MAPLPRLVGLDRLRAGALLLMLVQHLTGWFMGDARAALPGWDGFVITDVSAPAFTVAAGASGVLLSESLRRSGRRFVDATIVRRYGLLLPLGMVLHQVLWGDALSWGVLETLGLAATASTLLARRLSGVVTGVAAAVALVAGPRVVEAMDGRDDLVGRVLGVGFPLVTYIGFALIGAAGARYLLRHPHAGRSVLAIAGALVVAVGVAVVAGRPPDRHPGTLVEFVLPGVAGTLLLYGLLDVVRLPAAVDGVLQRAARHTLGIFVGHYGIYWVLRSLDLLGRLSSVAGVVLAVTVAVALALVAPLVPPLPWSPRTGRRRQAPKTPASTSGTGRSS